VFVHFVAHLVAHQVRKEREETMAEDRFSYQRLRVYDDMIRSISLAEDVACNWDRVHAIADHFGRASEGALVCLAEACRTRQAAARNEAVGYSLGSVLECAGCFDIASCKSLCSQEESNHVKQSLNHERLDAYQLSLQVIRSIASFRFLDRLPRSDFRRIDEAATSIVLNIAEGNGRFAHLDHGRFLDIANRSNTRLAARLEICAIRSGIDQDEATELTRLLVRIDQMTAKLAGVWRNQE